MSLFSLVDVRPLFLCEFKKFSLIWGYSSKTNMFCFLFFVKVDVFYFLSFPYPALNFIWQNGYYLGRQMSREMIITKNSGGAFGHHVWTKLWKRHLPNKIKLFGWRAWKDILPIRANLVKRNVLMDDQCEICKRYPKTTLHTIWECGTAQDIWAGCPIQLQKFSVLGHVDVINLMVELMVLLVERARFFFFFWVQAWLIWWFMVDRYNCLVLWIVVQKTS